jgi:hypothetical protein
VNPEARERALLVSRLRAHARIEDEGHRIDLMQAANEIENLGRLVELVDDIAVHGLRTDMHPTVGGVIKGDSPSTMYTGLCAYFGEAETHLKNRAKEARSGAQD